jgi:hypothetical protein
MFAAEGGHREFCQDRTDTRKLPPVAFIGVAKPQAGRQRAKRETKRDDIQSGFCQRAASFIAVFSETGACDCHDKCTGFSTVLSAGFPQDTHRVVNRLSAGFPVIARRQRVRPDRLGRPDDELRDEAIQAVFRP